MAPFHLDFLLLLPDLFLLVSTLVLLLLGLLLAAPGSAPLVSWGSIFALVLCLILQWNRLGAGGPWGLASDPLSAFFRYLLLAGAVLLLLLFQGLHRRDSAFPFEFPILLLLATLAYLLLAGCTNFLVLYLALELGSFCLYLLAALRRSSLFSTESGLKYFLLGGLSSAILLLGLAFLYGQSGTLAFGDWALLLVHWPPASPLPTFGLLLLAAGLAFKLALAPFHLWAPDVYDGAPLPSTAYFAVLAKLAVLALAIRLLHSTFFPLLAGFSPLLLSSGTLSILVGTLGALAQRRLKRLLAYSAIVHGGWVMVALGSGSALGLFAAAAYSLVYLVLGLNLFGLLLVLRRRSGDLRFRTLEQLSPLFRADPALAAVLASNLLSLAGIPPLAGFAAKLLVLVSLGDGGHYPLAGGLVLVAVLSAVYYIRLLRVLFFDRPLRWSLLRPLPPGASLPLFLSTLANLLALPLAFTWLPLPLLFLCPDPVIFFFFCSGTGAAAASSTSLPVSAGGVPAFCWFAAGIAPFFPFRWILRSFWATGAWPGEMAEWSKALRC